MERIEGVVLDGERIVLPTANVWMEQCLAPNGREEWYGYLDLPAGLDLVSKGYDFKARDGRMGRLRVLWSLARGQAGTRAEFRGAGPFR